MSFNAMLARGKVGEGIIAKWLMSYHGYSILPVYEKEIHEGKGPQLFTTEGQFIAPDLFIIRGDEFMWVEAKTKSAFTWHRATRCWVTGIDLRHYENYIKVQRITRIPVWLFFLHLDGKAKDTPQGMESPTGLFGKELSELQEVEHHRWGMRMVYWDVSNLAHLCSLDELAQLDIDTRKLPIMVSVPGTCFGGERLLVSDYENPDRRYESQMQAKMQEPSTRW